MNQHQKIEDSPVELDDALAGLLAEQLRCEVQLCDADQTAAEETIREETIAGAIRRPSQACVRCQTDIATIAIRLPAGRVAVWHCSAETAQQSANHAQAVLALEKMRSEKNQLQAEAEALATQVISDFEELSLIQSLAASLALPHEQGSVGELVLRFLRPLADGIGAVSIAAVFCIDGSEEMATPYWSGEAIVSDRSLYRLIQSHRDDAVAQPVLRNGRSPSSDPAETLREVILVECRSEGRLHGWLVACNRIDDAANDAPWAQVGFTTIQASLLETATNQLAAQLHNLRLLRQKEELFTDVVCALVSAVEARDPYTCGHSERVALFAKCLASANGESPAGCERIYLTGLLHDVGKIAIPDGVLQKPGKLDEDERAIIETHTDAGWRILHELDALREILPGVLHHHEMYDGKGYPDGLVGKTIPLDGRILSVCDAFDAMTSDRPYRKGMPTEDAMEILSKGAGTSWDPKLVELFIENIDAIEAIRLRHRPRRQTSRPAPDLQPAADLQLPPIGPVTLH